MKITKDMKMIANQLIKENIKIDFISMVSIITSPISKLKIKEIDFGDADVNVSENGVFINQPNWTRKEQARFEYYKEQKIDENDVIEVVKNFGNVYQWKISQEKYLTLGQIATIEYITENPTKFKNYSKQDIADFVNEESIWKGK